MGINKALMLDTTECFRYSMYVQEKKGTES